MTPLQNILASYRQAAITEREKGTYFEELICTYLRYEATYRDLYCKVWKFADWAREQGLPATDTGIDLVAQVRGSGEYHAIQCKFYAEDYHIQKADIDSFFTASGKKPFVHRLIVATTSSWSNHARDALQGQQPPVSKIDLHDLENSQIDWAKYQPDQPPVLKPQKSLRRHQELALKRVEAGLKNADRGKLIMACGTGKTFTSLKIAERLAGAGKRVLFLVPSLALLSQTLTEWTQESTTPLHSFAVCSDSDVGNQRKKQLDDVVQVFAHELRYPATTEPQRLAKEFSQRHDAQHMSVVFSTYHSIEVISVAQHEFELGEFDLIICDEAHRTTGVTFAEDDDSNFVKVHDAGFIRAAKRLYMTATPRIYGDLAKATAEKDNATLYSMDNEEWFGEALSVLTFSEAVKSKLLVDYKVIVLSIDEAHVSRRLQELLSDEDNQLKINDAAKIVGCWKALTRQDTREFQAGDSAPMQRAVAFCQVIERQSRANNHKVSSKGIASVFQRVVEEYQKQENIEQHARLTCEAAHVDGSMNASEKEQKLTWLKAELPARTCRILSNVRCLSEGVDVPALDAVLFLTPRNSQVDVVQSVGRVMRNAPGKRLGYVILPVVIPANLQPHEALDNNKVYQVVWQVLQALRSHDDRFDAMVNKLELLGRVPAQMEVIAVTDKLSRKTAACAGKSEFKLGTRAKVAAPTSDKQLELTFAVGEIERAIYAKIVQKCGNRHHWEDWANDIAQIANTHITRITTIIENPANSAARVAFASFANELRADLNGSISDAEVVEMLAQHLITKPVFEALFQGYSFAKHNPISLAMQGVLQELHQHHLEKEADTLTQFYESVKLRAEGIDSAEGRQKIVVELYDKFFRNAFPRMTERLGIVYTPVEVVDFIIQSVNDILQREFGQTLGSDGVHIIDPFTGTGTFITRLLHSGLISPAELPRKYAGQIHANEIVLLAYYIAAINIESVYHELAGGDYQPFTGICLTDTFQLHEREPQLSDLLIANSDRRTRQRKLDIRVIIGNPPYSAGQENENDSNKNTKYPGLDERIRTTYAAKSKTTNLNSLYDSYIRAIRWASDRIGNRGVIGLVTNAGYLDSNTADGLRKCLVEEFTSLYVFHLRGNQRTSGELSRKEGGKIFGSGSRAPIAITLFVKNPNSPQRGQIFWHDIGDYLTREEKLAKIVGYASISGITAANGWQLLTPDQHGDWINQRDGSFGAFISLGDKRDKASVTLFESYSRGLESARDAWVYNYSKSALEENMRRMIEFYNSEVDRYAKDCEEKANASYPEVESFVNNDPAKISWTSELKAGLNRHISHHYETNSLILGIYRPFTKQWVYFNAHFNHRVSQMPRIFPHAGGGNRVICVSGRGSTKDFYTIMVDILPDSGNETKIQCFPLYLYDTNQPQTIPDTQRSLFGDPPPAPQGVARREAITDAGLAHFREGCPGETIGKEDLFYYVYGVLHSPTYRARYADNLNKELPRIPLVKSAAAFWGFCRAGRELAELHINYETVPCHPVRITLPAHPQPEDYRVEKMRWGKTMVAGKSVEDRTTVIYNAKITISDIPLAAYDYILNGKSSLVWVMERQSVTTHKESGIINDANRWATETIGNPRYPLELFQRIITVSLETQRIVNQLPELEL